MGGAAEVLAWVARWRRQQLGGLRWFQYPKFPWWLHLERRADKGVTVTDAAGRLVVSSQPRRPEEPAVWWSWRGHEERSPYTFPAARPPRGKRRPRNPKNPT
jgi:hypothetical protein